MNVVDSSGWLAYFADEEGAEFFAPPIEDTELLLVPSICAYEVFKVVLREKDVDHAFQAVGAMRLGTIMDLDFELALEAAALSTREKLPFADSVIYATALRFEADLWTQDAHFEGKSSVRFKHKSER